MKVGIAKGKRPNFLSKTYEVLFANGSKVEFDCFGRGTEVRYKTGDRDYSAAHPCIM